MAYIAIQGNRGIIGLTFTGYTILIVSGESPHFLQDWAPKARLQASLMATQARILHAFYKEATSGVYLDLQCPARRKMPDPSKTSPQ